MAYWLLKTEPETFSWEDQVKRGAKGEPWTGVRNFIARSHLKAMKKGDHAFFYHTGNEKQVVGIVEVIREAYPDPTDSKGKRYAGGVIWRTENVSPASGMPPEVVVNRTSMALSGLPPPSKLLLLMVAVPPDIKRMPAVVLS